jgi:ketosteroid isomerase-like protein
MAEDSDVRLARDAYDAFTKGDLAALNDVYADDIVFHFPGRNPLAGDKRSKKKVFEFFGQIAERSGGTFRLDVREVGGGNGYVTALVGFEAEREGKTFTGDGVQVSRIEAGKIVEFWGFSNDTYAMDEFWS